MKAKRRALGRSTRHARRFIALTRDRERIVARLGALLRVGDHADLRMVDLKSWVDDKWMQVPLPELYGTSPAQTLQRRGGWTSVERLLERMAGGVPA